MRSASPRPSSSAPSISRWPVFAAGLFYFVGSETGLAFVTGYLIEKSLSLDNIFVFVLIFSHFAVPPVLPIPGALLGHRRRAGAARFADRGRGGADRGIHWILYLFGLLLVASGIKMLLAAGAEPDHRQ
jgi:Membrane protein TerC, possibly involved in tellurium resistance